MISFWGLGYLQRKLGEKAIKSNTLLGKIVNFEEIIFLILQMITGCLREEENISNSAGRCV